MENWLVDSLLAFVLCPDVRCRYGEGFVDIRLAPEVRP